jgi:SAM-dependent methyltransferase
VDANLAGARKAELVQKHGPWTAHDYKLCDGVYTIGSNNEWTKLQRILQVVSDLAGRPIDQLRILDLACLEGGYAIEFARHGAQVVGVEGRAANLEKAQFGKETLGLENLTFVQDDVRNLSREKYGEFDVVLCLGILYHLNAPDVLEFIDQIAQVCRNLAIFDTYCGLGRVRQFSYKGQQYSGRQIIEHRAGASEDVQGSKWSSLHNMVSVWLTRASLYNALSAFGFSSVYECNVPTELTKPADRYTFVAVKGKKAQLLGLPDVNSTMLQPIPERHRPLPHRKQQFWFNLSEQLTNLIPYAMRRRVKTMLGRA